MSPLCRNMTLVWSHSHNFIPSHIILHFNSHIPILHPHILIPITFSYFHSNSHIPILLFQHPHSHTSVTFFHTSISTVTLPYFTPTFLFPLHFHTSIPTFHSHTSIPTSPFPYFRYIFPYFHFNSHTPTLHPHIPIPILPLHSHSHNSIPMSPPTVTGNWTTPSQYGFKPVGRMGHSSVYSLETGLIYVYGGREGENLLDQVLVYDPITYTWSRLTRRYFTYVLVHWVQNIISLFR